MRGEQRESRPAGLTRRRRWAFLTLLLVAGVVGCGGTIVDETRAEAEIQTQLEETLGIEAQDVDCPSDIQVERGERFDCRVNVSAGGPLTATLKVLNEQADLQIIGVESQGG